MIAASRLIDGHIRPTVAQMIADSKIIGWFLRGSMMRLASLNEHGLPMTSSSVYAQANSMSMIAHIGSRCANIYTPPCLLMAPSTDDALFTIINVLPLITYRL